MKVPCASPLRVTLQTGGFDKPYAYGMTMALASRGVRLDVIGSDDVYCPEFRADQGIRFLNFGESTEASLVGKLVRILKFYSRLFTYAAKTKNKLFHVLWNNRLQLFDRVVLMIYYKLLRKKIVLTAHNVNAGKRDNDDSWLNRSTLRFQYRIVDHIFVHTEKMKKELVTDYAIKKSSVTVIPFGINNSVPNTELTPSDARRKIGLNPEEKVILFFGNIGPYKGVEYLVEAFQKIALLDTRYRLLIVGKLRGGCDAYFDGIRKRIENAPSRSQIVLNITYVPDEDAEIYFKAADVLVLPYKEVFQSGVLFLGYSFGLPVIATDVGSLREDVIEGSTGYICRVEDPDDLSEKLSTYFNSDLFKNLDQRRHNIRDFALLHHSWTKVSDLTLKVYSSLAPGIDVRI